jgi:hypothetical protein
MSQRGQIYKGYAFTDATTKLDDGRFLARAVITKLDGQLLQPQSQRFLDLEICRGEADAGRRSVAGAQAWIDAELTQDGLRLPRFVHGS